MDFLETCLEYLTIYLNVKKCRQHYRVEMTLTILLRSTFCYRLRHNAVFSCLCKKFSITMCFWALSACSDLSSDDCCGCPCWSGDWNCSGSQRTSCLLLWTLLKFSFTTIQVYFFGWCCICHGSRSQKISRNHILLWLMPVLNTGHNVAWFEAFEVKRILLCLTKDLFPNHILCYCLYWSEPAKWLLSQGWRGQRSYHVAFLLWTLQCMGIYLHFCENQPTENNRRQAGSSWLLYLHQAF